MSVGPMSSEASFRLRQVTSSLRSSVEVLELAPSWATKSDAPLSAMLEWLEGNRGNKSLSSFLTSITTSHRYASAASKADIRWSFVGGWLLLLDSLRESLLELASHSSRSEHDIGSLPAGPTNKPPRPPPDLLSLRDLACLHAALEVIVFWGIFPCLKPGVGQSTPEARQISKAVRIHRRVRLWGLEVARTEGISSMSAAFQLEAILSCLKSTLTVPQLEALFLPKYLPDILAGYLQLSHGYSKGGEGDEGAELPGGALDTWGPWLCASSLRKLLEVDGSPTWLKIGVGKCLTSCLLRPGGLESVLYSFLSGVDHEGEISSHHSNPNFISAADKLGSLLASRPESVAWEVYTASVFPQLHELLIRASSSSPPKILSSSLLRTALCMVDKLSVSFPRELSELVITPCLSSILVTQQKLVKSCHSGEVETSVKCLELLSCEFEPSPSLVRVLIDVEALPCALLLFSHCHVAACTRLLEVSRRIVLSLLHRCPLENLADQVYLALSTTVPQCDGTGHRVFLSGSDGDIIVVYKEAAGVDDGAATFIAENTAILERLGPLGQVLTASSRYVATAVFAEALGELLGSGGLAEDSPLPGSLFCSLLQRHLRSRCVTNVEGHERDSGMTNGKANRNSGDDDIMIGIVIVSLAEAVGPRIFVSGTQILECFSHLLLAAAEEVTSKLENISQCGGYINDNDFEWSICRDGLCEVCLGLLTAMIEMGEERRTEQDEQLLRGMLKPLEILSSSCDTSCIAEMSTTLRASILTRDLSLVERRHEKDRSAATAQLYNTNSLPSFGEGEEAMLFALEDAKKDLRSEAAPMRARGIVTLTRLVRRAGMNKVETNVADQFIETYVGMLSDDDSYVYLAAIQGLATLSDKLPTHVIPRLVGMLCGTSSTNVDSGEGRLQLLSWPQRHKLAEAIMFSARRCGEAIPKYAGDFIGAFVRVVATRPPCNGSEEEIEAWQCFRAGCLSNLAEVCELLRWSLPRYASDVMDVALGVLKMETGPSSWFPAVGRGAVYLLLGIIRGCGADLLFILPDYLKSIRHSLQLVYQWGGDPVAKYLAEQSLRELDNIVHSHLTPRKIENAYPSLL